MRATVLATCLLLLAASLPAPILVMWDRNPETWVNQYRVYVKPGMAGPWATNYTVHGTNHLAVSTNMILLTPPDYLPATNALYTNSPVFSLPEWSWKHTNAMLTLAATAITFDNIESDMSDAITLTNKPAPPGGMRVIQFGPSGPIEVGFRDLPREFRLDWSEDLINWRDMASIAIHDQDAWPSTVWWQYPTTNDLRHFWRLVDLQ